MSINTSIHVFCSSNVKSIENDSNQAAAEPGAALVIPGQQGASGTAELFSQEHHFGARDDPEAVSLCSGRRRFRSPDAVFSSTVFDQREGVHPDRIVLSFF